MNVMDWQVVLYNMIVYTHYILYAIDNVLIVWYVHNNNTSVYYNIYRFLIASCSFVRCIMYIKYNVRLTVQA